VITPVKSLLCLFILFITIQHVAAEEWRGIVPLRSTRADVARVFGECANAERFCEFLIPNEEITITLSSNQDCPEGVPADTVLMIERQLQNGTTLTALGLNKRHFKTFNPWYSGNNDYRAYFDEKSGLLLKSFQGHIFQINYIPPKGERRICADYYRKPKQFVQVLPEHVPYVDVRCPETAFAGDKVAITAFYVSTGERRSLLWNSSAGRIIEGQNTRKIMLDTTGLDGQMITVTVERRTGLFHRMSASCTIRVLPKPDN